MKIKIICDNDKDLAEFSRKIKKELLKKEVNKVCKIKFVSKSSIDFDICIIISNDLEFAYTNCYELKVNNISDSRIIILTSNLRSANIIGCLNITPYVYYIKANINSIIFKIIKIYQRNSNNLYKVPVKKDSYK